MLSDPPLELRIGLKGLVNVEEESGRLKREIAKLQADIQFIDNKLGKESFRAKAPRELIEKEESRKKNLIEQLKELESALSRLAAIG
jgi:valyl-tRNA synthetase